MFTILRSYNSRKILDLIGQLTATGMTNHFTVVIDAKKDAIDTPRLLDDFESAIPIVALSLETYGWSKALNAGIRSLPPMKTEQELVMIVSNEVQIIPQEISMLKDAATRANASCGYALFDGRTEPTYRLPRNTYIVWKRRVVEDLNLFDETLDQDLGMEDYEMVLRAFRLRQLLPYAGPKSSKLDLSSYANLEEKRAREVRAVAAIEQRYPQEVVERIRTHIALQNEDQAKSYL